MKLQNPFAFLKAIFTRPKQEPKEPEPPTHLSPLRKNPMRGIACNGPKAVYSRHIDGPRDHRAAYSGPRVAFEAALTGKAQRRFRDTNPTPATFLS